MNSLEALARNLRALRDDLRARMNRTSNIEESDRLYLQMLEINHRIQMINSVLFSANTDRVTENLDAIEAATEEIGQAIADIQQLADIIGAVKNILGIVDGVIDLIT